jgi:RNA polymerase sigma-70 factor, ECF subfamily
MLLRGGGAVSDARISPHHADELSEFFTSHAGELFGYACFLTRGDRALADDLVQAAFEAACWAWQGLRSLAEERRRNWLKKTLANIAMSGFRREAAFRDRLPRIEIRYRKMPADPLEHAFSSITLERCWQIIRDMPKRQHAVAVLRWQLDMKEADIAEILAMSPKTVSTHLHRARRALIAQLGPDGPVTGEDPEGASS